MKFGKFIAILAVMAAMTATVSCNNNKNEASKGAQIAGDPLPEGIEAAESGPLLTIKDVTAKAGEMAEVTLHVENADAAWNMCGLHITYPDVLVPEIRDAENDYVNMKKGDASEYSIGSIGKEWTNNKIDYLIDNKLGSIFFTEIFDGNEGLNGDIVTFYLKVPDNAVSGTEYPIEYMYIDGDLFSNAQGDESIELYAFENWQGGKITVE